MLTTDSARMGPCITTLDIHVCGSVFMYPRPDMYTSVDVSLDMYLRLLEF